MALSVNLIDLHPQQKENDCDAPLFSYFPERKTLLKLHWIIQ